MIVIEFFYAGSAMKTLTIPAATGTQNGNLLDISIVNVPENRAPEM